jgi:hypothetical protein
MKRIFIMIAFELLINTALFAGARFVRVEYVHSRQVQHSKITIELGSERNEDRIFYAKLVTEDRRLGGFILNIERVIGIDKEYFDMIYNRVLDLNFKDIIKSSEGIVGADGTTNRLTVGTRQNYIELETWSPFYRLEERKTEEMYIIFSELFSLFNLEEEIGSWILWSG